MLSGGVTLNGNVQWPYPGARWWKFDFHTHTPASLDYGKGQDQGSLRKITPRDWLLGFMRAGIDCVAVTDHNSGDWIDPLRTALSELTAEEPEDFRPLNLFPGVEITANGNVHVLALLDVESDSADVSALLGAVGFGGRRGASDAAVESSPINVVQAIHERSGIPILAHVDGPSGAWKLPGNTLKPLLDAEGLFAIEVVDPHGVKPELYQQRKLNWAEVLGSDSHHPSGKAGQRHPGSHYTWVKMAQPSLDGVRLALIDGGGISVGRSDDPQQFDPFDLPNHFIEELEVENARFMGRGQSLKLACSPWMTALVGGRGTGKSTIVHALRLAARRRAELVEEFEQNSLPRLTFEAFERVPKDQDAQGGLNENTLICATLMRDGARHRLRWRWGDDPVKVLDSLDEGTGVLGAKHGVGLSDRLVITKQESRPSDDPAVQDDDGAGGWTPSVSQAITPERFPLRIFSQGQIAALASDNQQALLRVIDEAAGASGEHGQLQEAKNAFQSLRVRMREIEAKLKGVGELAVKRQDVERKLKRFEDDGHTEVLTNYRRRGRQSQEVERQFQSAFKVADDIFSFASELELENLPDGLFGERSDADPDRGVLGILEALRSAVSVSARELEAAAQRLRETLNGHKEGLSNSAWQAAVDDANRRFNELVANLRREGVADPSEYGGLVQDRQQLEGESKRLHSQSEALDRLSDEAQALHQVLQEKRRALSDARVRFLAQTLAENQFVRIEVQTCADDPRFIERSLREALRVTDRRFADDILVMGDDGPDKGVVVDLLVDLPSDRRQRVEEVEKRVAALHRRLQSACLGSGDFGGAFNNYLKRENERTPELLDGLLTWFPEDGLKVEYSRRGDGRDFQPIAQASAGQRSAAMLAFLLAHGDEPLVLDQPEDDLDNNLIYDLVVRQIREQKLKRQVIVVTHNPNIVVNGDAELVHALDFRSGQCRIVESGSLQEPQIREEVCRIMEGGREAFERRYRRLGRDLEGAR
ncbi:MAG: chromosome segregation protein SMC [Gammaproteobacteria bacterium]|nr:chromosome segregation protein SMC [Gammaproteobacteria bacterium]